MSYVFAAYAVDLAKIGAAIGSNDEALAQKIIGSNRDEFDEELQQYEPSELTHKEALRNLLAGTASASQEYARHGYAFKELSRYLSAKNWAGYLLESQMDVIAWSLHRSPVELPPDDSFPTLGYMTHEQLHRKIVEIESSWTEIEEGELSEDAEMTLKVMKFAAKKGLDVVFTYG